MPGKSVDSKLDKIADNILAFFPLYYRKILKPISPHKGIPINMQFLVLAILRNVDFIRMSEIGYKLGIPKPNVTLLVDKLIEQGFVKRKPDLKDRRVVYVQITGKGLKFIEARKVMAKKNIREYLAGISDEELDKLYQAAETFITLMLKPESGI